MSPSIQSTGPANLMAAPTEGIRRAVKDMNKAGEEIASGDISPALMVDLLQAAILVKANTATVQTADQLLGTLLNTRA